MATADELAADALEVANKFLAEQRQRLVEQAAGDLGLLAVAARIVQEGAKPLPLGPRRRTPGFHPADGGIRGDQDEPLSPRGSPPAEFGELQMSFFSPPICGGYAPIFCLRRRNVTSLAPNVMASFDRVWDQAQVVG